MQTKDYSPPSNFLTIKKNVSIWIPPPHRWDPYGHFGVSKRWGNKTYQSTSKSQSWSSWFVTKLNAWWCGIGSNIFLKTLIIVVCLSLSAWHGLEYHYNKGKHNFTRSAIPHHHRLFWARIKDIKAILRYKNFESAAPAQFWRYNQNKNCSETSIP